MSAQGGHVTGDQWNSTAKLLHWMIALMILVEVPVGFMMANLYGPGLKHADVRPIANLMGQIHHTNGFLLLLAMLLRLGWRFAHPAPGMPATMPRVQALIARITQALFYVLVIALPLSGWMALSVLADSAAFGKTQIWFFGSDALIPRILPPKPWNAPYGYGFFGAMHRWLIYTGAVLLVLHAGAALWHHFWRRDSVLARMWPNAARSGQVARDA